MSITCTKNFCVKETFKKPNCHTKSKRQHVGEKNQPKLSRRHGPVCIYIRQMSLCSACLVHIHWKQAAVHLCRVPPGGVAGVVPSGGYVARGRWKSGLSNRSGLVKGTGSLSALCSSLNSPVPMFMGIPMMMHSDTPANTRWWGCEGRGGWETTKAEEATSHLLHTHRTPSPSGQSRRRQTGGQPSSQRRPASGRSPSSWPVRTWWCPEFHPGCAGNNRPKRSNRQCDWMHLHSKFTAIAVLKVTKTLHIQIKQEKKIYKNNEFFLKGKGKTNRWTGGEEVAPCRTSDRPAAWRGGGRCSCRGSPWCTGSRWWWWSEQPRCPASSPPWQTWKFNHGQRSVAGVTAEESLVGDAVARISVRMRLIARVEAALPPVTLAGGQGGHCHKVLQLSLASLIKDTRLAKWDTGKASWIEEILEENKDHPGGETASKESRELLQNP